MERRPTRILTILAVSLLALTLIAPWVLGQDPDPITEIRRQAGQGDVDAQFRLGYIITPLSGCRKSSTTPQNCNNDLCDRVLQRNPRPDPAS